MLNPSVVNTIRKALCVWTNRIHPAVMFEVTTLTVGLPRSAAGLAQMDSRLAAAREKWGGISEAPEQKLLINRLAINATATHLEDCRTSSGHMRGVSPHVLDELLPKRNAKDVFFRVPDIRGDIPAGITLDYDVFGWQAGATKEATAGDARMAPLARIAFAELEKSIPSAFGGGEIVDEHGNAVLKFG